MTLKQNGNSLSLEVLDEGSGIEPGKPLGLGLLGMRERVNQIGGRLDIGSDGHGTTLKAVLPVANAKENRT